MYVDDMFRDNMNLLKKKSILSLNKILVLIINMAVKKLAKKVLNPSKAVVKAPSAILEKTGMSITGHIIQAVFVVLLIVYSGVVVQFLPVSFLAFFDNIIVKIVFLVVIAVVGLFSPAVALFLAIALVVMLQVGQKKQLEGTVQRVVQRQASRMMDTPFVKKEVADEDIVESMDGEGYLDPEVMDAGRSYMTRSSATPAGFNQNDSCLSCSSGNDTNAQCSGVKTWKDTLGAQGLEGITGFQSTLGYPL
jgi:hypothetical protein